MIDKISALVEAAHLDDLNELVIRAVPHRRRLQYFILPNYIHDAIHAPWCICLVNLRAGRLPRYPRSLAE